MTSTPRRQAKRGAGSTGASPIADLVAKLDRPRPVWVMLPAGVTGKAVEELASSMTGGDTIIDGGNSYYRDDLRRAAKLWDERHPLRRLRHQRRRLRPGTRLLPDDRRRGRTVVPPGADFQDASRPARRPRRARRGAAATPRRRAGLPALRPARRRAFREDGPQRHRVRHDGRLRRGPEHPQARQRRPAPVAADAETTPLRDPQLYQYEIDRPDRRSLAPRQRCRLLAARLDGRRAGGTIRTWPAFAGAFPTPAKAAGRSQAAIDEAVPAPVISAALFARFESQGRSRLCRPAAVGHAQAVRRTSERKPGGTDHGRATAAGRRTAMPWCALA